MANLRFGRELTDAETKSLVAFLGALTDKPRAAGSAGQKARPRAD